MVGRSTKDRLTPIGREPRPMSRNGWQHSKPEHEFGRWSCRKLILTFAPHHATFTLSSHPFPLYVPSKKISNSLWNKGRTAKSAPKRSLRSHAKVSFCSVEEDLGAVITSPAPLIDTDRVVVWWYENRGSIYGPLDPRLRVDNVRRTSFLCCSSPEERVNHRPSLD